MLQPHQVCGARHCGVTFLLPPRVLVHHPHADVEPLDARVRRTPMRVVESAALAAAVLLAAGCGGDDAAPTASPEAPVGLPEHVVVFTPDDLAEVDAAFSGEATWVPSAADVRRADAALRARVSRTAGIDTPYADHVRQVAGLDDGVVLVNALCDGDAVDWRAQWVTVDDGGACFWQAAVRDGVVVSFSVNGEG